MPCDYFGMNVLSFRCRSPMIWNEEREVLLCREIMLTEPYQFKKGSKERGDSWSKLAVNLSNTKLDPPFSVDQRAVREHFAAIRKRYEKKASDEKKASGIEIYVTELDVLMEEILNKVFEYEKNFEVSDKSKQEKQESDEAKAKEVRRKCIETFAETSKRKHDVEGGEKPKKSRSTGSETIGYLKEKAEKDRWVTFAGYWSVLVSVKSNCVNCRLER